MKHEQSRANGDRPIRLPGSVSKGNVNKGSVDSGNADKGASSLAELDVLLARPHTPGEAGLREICGLTLSRPRQADGSLFADAKDHLLHAGQLMGASGTLKGLVAIGGGGVILGMSMAAMSVPDIAVGLGLIIVGGVVAPCYWKLARYCHGLRAQGQFTPRVR